MSAFEDVFDQDDASDVELSDNVAADYLEYHRGNVVGHEAEGLLMYLSMLTGWAYSKNCHNNVLAKGPPGSGKSLTKNTVEGLFDSRDTYTKTSASGNAILDSVEWDLALIAPMDEIDKIDKPIVEVLKSSNPEDDGYAKDRNVEDPDAKGGYSPTEVSADANPWILLYAPSSKKGGINDELEDRALILYFSNDKHTRRGIGRKEFGHEDIDIAAEDGEYEYIYDTQALAARLREHVRELPVANHYEDPEADDEDPYLVSRTGDTPVYTPPWVWYAVEPVFNIDEDYTNRVYGLVNNVIEASALCNHHERARREIEVYVDEDSTETETREAVVVGPQDVANVMSCLPTLLSTTHQLTPLKRHILDAVDATEPKTQNSGTTVSRVQSWLEDNDIPHPSRSTLKDRLDELDEEYYLEKFDSSAGPNGQADAYERPERGAGALQTPRTTNLQRHADRDGVQLATADYVDVDPADPFAGTTDPIREQSFEETVEQFEAQFASSDVTVNESSTEAAAFMGPDEDRDGGEDEPAQATLDGDVDQGDAAGDLEPEGEVENPTEAWLLSALAERAGEPFGSRHDVTHFAGVVDRDSHSSKVDVVGTVLDPDHELWQDRADLRDDRVVSEADTLRELNGAWTDLRQKSLATLDESAGPPEMGVLRVADE